MSNMVTSGMMEHIINLSNGNPNLISLRKRLWPNINENQQDRKRCKIQNTAIENSVNLNNQTAKELSQDIAMSNAGVYPRIATCKGGSSSGSGNSISSLDQQLTNQDVTTINPARNFQNNVFHQPLPPYDLANALLMKARVAMAAAAQMVQHQQPLQQPLQQNRQSSLSQLIYDSSLTSSESGQNSISSSNSSRLPHSSASQIRSVSGSSSSTVKDMVNAGIQAPAPSFDNNINQALAVLSSAGIVNNINQPAVQSQPCTIPSFPLPMPLAHTPPIPQTSILTMHTWSLQKLEAHMCLLSESNQPIPKALYVLLSEARRKEVKKTAKRVANRKSACTSRARKKALVEEMTKTNQRLRRQALILSLLPDLVIAIGVNNVISFCSARVEQTLQYKADDLFNANLMDILVPGSRIALRHLIDAILASDVSTVTDNAINVVSKATRKDGFPPAVSEQSFPFSVVVKNKPIRNSNQCTEKVNSSTTNPSCLSSSSIGSRPSSDEDHGARSSNCEGAGTTDDSSAEAKMRKSSESLNRNVQLHKEQLHKEVMSNAHTDDVTGAAVTANNADARLSSLQHCPIKRKKNSIESQMDGTKVSKSTSSFETFEEHLSTSSESLSAGIEGSCARGTTENVAKINSRVGPIENSSEDSGYNREADEDSNSASSNCQNGVTEGRFRPLAPTCNICLIRADLTTIWCEVTISIKTSPVGGETVENLLPPNDKCLSESSKPLNAVINDQTQPRPVDEVKELLLCLRPIRDGAKVTEELRFNTSSDTVLIPSEKEIATPVKEESCSKDTGSFRSIVSPRSGNREKRPMKKRLHINMCPVDIVNVGEGSVSSAQFSSRKAPLTTDTEKSVVESLILMLNES